MVFILDSSIVPTHMYLTLLPTLPSQAPVHPYSPPPPDPEPAPLFPSFRFQYASMEEEDQRDLITCRDVHLGFFFLPDPELHGEVSEAEGVPGGELHRVLYSRQHQKAIVTVGGDREEGNSRHR